MKIDPYHIFDLEDESRYACPDYEYPDQRHQEPEDDCDWINKIDWSDVKKLSRN